MARVSLTLFRRYADLVSFRYDKLYGHGFEIRCLASSQSGQYLASSSRATSLEYASIHLRDTTSNQVVGKPLTGHTLAITRIRFSPDDGYILAVGRDRSWHLYRYAEADGACFKGNEKPSHLSQAISLSPHKPRRTLE
jgi:WD40 repeat protein